MINNSLIKSNVHNAGYSPMLWLDGAERVKPSIMQKSDYNLGHAFFSMACSGKALTSEVEQTLHKLGTAANKQN